VKNDASKDATISYNKQEITLIYEKLNPVPVTVHYVDDEGKTIHFDENLTGYYGQKVSANIMDINGYRFKKVKNDASKDA
ncbi:MucBP domain-containing protein, partial [Lactococcus lactis]